MPRLPSNEKDAFHIHIRIHKNPKDPAYEEFFKRHFRSVVSCYETHSNRPHIHILAEISGVRSAPLREMLVKLFKFNGNTDFSVKNVFPDVKDFREISKYVCKGDSAKCDPCVTFRTEDWSDERIKTLQNEYWLVPKVTFEENVTPSTENLVLDEPQPRKPRTKTWTEKWIEKLEEDYPLTDWDWNDIDHKLIVQKHLLKNLGEAKKMFNEYKLKEWVYCAFNTLNAANFENYILYNLNKILC